MNDQVLGSRIAALRGQVRRLIVFHGLCWVVAGVLPLLILACLADWLFHLDVFVRLALLLSVSGLLIRIVHTRVIRPLVVRFADLDIALRIEERWPGLQDRLTSTIQFLRYRPDDERYGSAALREATIKQAIEETRSIDFREAIAYRPIIRAAALAALALGLALLLALAEPSSSRIALRRLFLPWGLDRWPQQTHLVLSEPGTTLKIARGDPFVLSVRVQPGDRIPESARATYRFADGEEIIEPLRASEAGEFHGRLETVNQPLKFSVTAGDDATSIQDVEVKVVPPPVLGRLAIRLISPPYTGLPVQTLAPGLTSFRVLEGTKIELEGQANKPLAAAELQFSDQQPALAVALDPLRTTLRASFPVHQNVAFSFALADSDGFRNRDPVRHDVRMFKDEPPRVVIVEPRTDRDIPPDALVPVRVELDDDFGLHSARLLYKVSAGESEPHEPVAIPLWSAPSDDATVVASSLLKHQNVGYDWDLAPLKLPIGSVIAFHAEARDLDSIKGPNLGKSREIRLRIVSKEDAARQFDEARRELREEIARILAMQRQAITSVDEAVRTLARTDRLPRTRRDDLNNAGLIQRQVGSRISNRDEGLEQRLKRLLDDLRNFKIANPEAQDQMQNMLARLDMLRDRHLGPAEQELTRAGKSLDQIADPPQGQSREVPRQEAVPPATLRDRDAAPGSRGKEEQSPSQPSGQEASSAQKSTAPKDATAARPSSEAARSRPDVSLAQIARQSLGEAKENQQAIALELQKMLADLGEFESYRGVVKDAQALLKKQEEAIKQTADAATKPDLAGKSAESLSPEQKADLANLGARQNDLAKSLQNLLERMDDLAKRIDQSDPLAASALRESAAGSRQQGTSAKMGEAAESLEKNQMGQARAQQEKARQELRDLVDNIASRRERELARLVKELKQAESDLRALRKRQAQNLQATREAGKNPNSQDRRDQLKRLAKEQAQIQQELKRQLQRLAKLGADRAGRAAADAQGKMGQAQEQLDGDEGEEAGKNEEEALADLNDAQDELENVRREAEERLAMEQLARMGDQLISLAQRQAKMVKDAENYETIRKQSGGKLTIAQRTGVRGLGQVQAGIKDETGRLIEQLDGAPVFALTLRRAAESMDTASTRLHAIKTDEETQKAIRAAAHRFEQLIDALKADEAKQAGQGGGSGGGGGGGGDGIPATAQLKMLRTLQQELNDRTEAFDELRRRSQELTTEQTKEAEQLANDQGSLADLARDLTRPRRDDGEE